MKVINGKKQKKKSMVSWIIFYYFVMTCSEGDHRSLIKHICFTLKLKNNMCIQYSSCQSVFQNPLGSQAGGDEVR